MAMSSTSRMNTGGVVGVNTDSNRAPARTVQHCMPVQMFAVEIGDEEGKKITTVAFKVGDMLYTDPNGESWAGSLRTIPKTSWLYRQLMEATDAFEKVAEVPKEDAVDITGGGKRG